jgi:hypothetical protein
LSSKKGLFMQLGKLTTAATVAAALGFGAIAVAQETPAQPAPEGQEAPAAAAAFSQDQLDAFVAAALEVSGIQQAAAERLIATEDEAEQQTVVEEANQQMIDAIEAEPGITVPEYVSIAEAAETDATLRAQLEELILAARDDRPAQ